MVSQGDLGAQVTGQGGSAVAVVAPACKMDIKKKGSGSNMQMNIEKNPSSTVITAGICQAVSHARGIATAADDVLPWAACKGGQSAAGNVAGKGGIGSGKGAMGAGGSNSSHDYSGYDGGPGHFALQGMVPTWQQGLPTEHSGNRYDWLLSGMVLNWTGILREPALAHIPMEALLPDLENVGDSSLGSWDQ